MDKQGLRTWIEISKSALKNNYNLFRKLISPKTLLMGVVKSNAYGHELLGMARELSVLGIDGLGVDSIVEANALRRAGINRPILVLGHTLPANFKLAKSKNISLTISNFENLRAALKSKLRLKIHIKIDTGMHRQGFNVKDLPAVLKLIRSSKNLIVEGVFTHFAAAKKPDVQGFTRAQIEKFKHAVKLAKKRYPKVIAHASASAGTLNYPEAHFDMVRVGVGLYGLWPSEETKKRWKSKLKLKPVLTWKTVISEINTVEKGERVGYDYSARTAHLSKLAVLPIGYWHGYWRAFSSKAYVLVKGKRCKVIGRVAMDMTVVDVTGVGAKVGDEVVLIGKQDNKEITADELANLAHTTNYEIVTRLNPLIMKFFV